jgi:hypothetical protein
MIPDEAHRELPTHQNAKDDTQLDDQVGRDEHEHAHGHEVRAFQEGRLRKTGRHRTAEAQDAHVGVTRQADQPRR